jgi:diguanylate cyclase
MASAGPAGDPVSFAPVIFGVALIAALVVLALRPIGVRFQRKPWVILSTGLALWGVGRLLVVQLPAEGGAPNVLLAAHFLIFSFYPWVFGALLLCARLYAANAEPLGPTRWLDQTRWLDGVIAGLTVGAAATAVSFGPQLFPGSNYRWESIIHIGYVLGDIVLVGLAFGALPASQKIQVTPVRYLRVALLVMAMADIVCVVNDAGRGTALHPETSKALWLLSAAMFAAAAWREPSGPPNPLPLARPTRVSLAALSAPGAWAALAAAVLLYATWRPVTAVGVALAAGGLLGAAIRTTLAVREAGELTDSRIQAVTDDLTGLGNRRLLHQRLGAAIDNRRDNQRIGLLLLDLDRFKEINDSLGHHIGDELLREIGRRLLSLSALAIVRLGGDEFAVVVTPLATTHDAVHIGRRILQLLAEPVLVAGMALRVEASIGVVLSPDHANDPSSLLRLADVAMYQAKESRTGVEVYTAARDRHRRQRVLVAKDLRDGVDANQLVLLYQPKALIHTGEITGVEALVRWDHPQYGRLGPDDFLPLAERFGMMRSLTHAVLEIAVDRLHHWQQSGIDITMAVNLSGSSLHDIRFPSDVSQILSDQRVSAESLVLEITEDTLVADPQRVRRIVTELRSLGIAIALDDYGTGYSALGHLRTLALDELKLDRSFVTNIDHNDRDAAIVRSTVELSHSLGMRVVAEGVETSEVYAALGRIGCDQAQGYLIGKPVTAHELEEWIVDRPVVAGLLPAISRSTGSPNLPFRQS